MAVLAIGAGGLLGIAAGAGATAAVTLGRIRQGVWAVEGLGAALGVALVLAVYFSPSDGCSDCEHVLGRWWEPAGTIAFAFVALLSWALGSAAGFALSFLIESFRRR
ncbi:MAG: hypothetical protein M3P18_19520 [Actinomycetota bacterium]|nr:hypothetical protein [Actinomycetota bacterium]